MGGIGSGGRRPGAGRKPKSSFLRSIDGGAGHRKPPAPDDPPTTSNQFAASPENVLEFKAPDYFSKEERKVWATLVPYALANRTLTQGTALAFERLCRNVALEWELESNQEYRGGPNHRGLIQRVDAGMLRFNLSPCGKPMYESKKPESAPPVNPLSRFLKRAVR